MRAALEPRPGRFDSSPRTVAPQTAERHDQLLMRRHRTPEFAGVSAALHPKPGYRGVRQESGPVSGADENNAGADEPDSSDAGPARTLEAPPATLGHDAKCNDHDAWHVGTRNDGLRQDGSWNDGWERSGVLQWWLGAHGRVLLPFDSGTAATTAVHDRPVSPNAARNDE